MSEPMDQTARPFLERIESLHADLESEKGKYLRTCKVLREDIKQVYSEAKTAGVVVKALRGLVKWRALERDQEKIETGLDDDEAAAYARLRETLGPLGASAAAAAGYGDQADDDDRDVRPRHLRLADEERRADENELARVGRGH